MLRAWRVPSSPHNSVVVETKAHLGRNLGLGGVSFVAKKVVGKCKEVATNGNGLGIELILKF
jgi:hypothetical protein